ncbi:YdbL family protein [Sphingomonas sp. GB1N7]|uniref:YdbL family protein n=1 Tax=Parasphingomonas caseinilytica TaxID=3096158 RepID=UPI003FA78B6A
MMKFSHVRGNIFAASAVLFACVSSAAFAQRDPAYAAAREAGQVGEQPNGYLGVVSGGASVQAIVDKINIQRKATYAEKAQAAGVTINDYGVTFGCNLIANTQPGEKYKAPDGSWKTRTAAAPERSPSCV